MWSIWRNRNDRIFRGSSSLSHELISRVALKITKWALVRKEYFNFNLNDILFNWEACMGCGLIKVRRSVPWSPPPTGALKFNVDGVSRGKLGPAGIGVSCNSKGEVLLSSHVL